MTTLNDFINKKVWVKTSIKVKFPNEESEKNYSKNMYFISFDNDFIYLSKDNEKLSEVIAKKDINYIQLDEKTESDW